MTQRRSAFAHAGEEARARTLIWLPRGTRRETVALAAADARIGKSEQEDAVRPGPVPLIVQSRSMFDACGDVSFRTRWRNCDALRNSRFG